MRPANLILMHNSTTHNVCGRRHGVPYFFLHDLQNLHVITADIERGVRMSDRRLMIIPGNQRSALLVFLPCPPQLAFLPARFLNLATHFLVLSHRKRYRAKSDPWFPATYGGGFSDSESCTRPPMLM